MNTTADEYLTLSPLGTMPQSTRPKERTPLLQARNITAILDAEKFRRMRALTKDTIIWILDTNMRTIASTAMVAQDVANSQVLLLSRFLDDMAKGQQKLSMLASMGVEQLISPSVKTFDIDFWTDKMADFVTANVDTSFAISSRTRVLTSENQVGELNSMLSELLELYFSPADLESDFVPPTDYAFRITSDLLRRAGAALLQSFPYGALAVDDTGGISVYWRKLERKVHLTIPANELGSAYIYHREGLDLDFEEGLSVQSLIRWLTWFGSAPHDNL